MKSFDRASAASSRTRCASSSSRAAQSDSYTGGIGECCPPAAIRTSARQAAAFCASSTVFRTARSSGSENETPCSLGTPRTVVGASGGSHSI